MVRPAANEARSFDPDELPDEAWVTAVSMLDLMGPRRMRALLATFSPPVLWRAVSEGRVLATAPRALLHALGPRADELSQQWRRTATTIDPASVWHAHTEAGVGVATSSSASYPTPFVDDIDPPPVVFSLGDPDALIGARVAIVGTRDCTRYGYDIARQFGAELAEAGVGVISGLALGVDGAAHSGALDAGAAPPIAIVGSGLDIVYPRRNKELWTRVTEQGVVLSEYPLGSPPTAWHFPSRNRLIAALADIVIVVESQEKGGSMITVDEAMVRGTPVMAVPGPITSRASAGTNKVLADGGLVVRDTTDVLLRLGMSDGARRRATERRPPPEAGDLVVLEAFGWQPATFDRLSLATGLGLYDLTSALDRLRLAGWIDHRGGWFERIAKPGG